MWKHSAIYKSIENNFFKAHIDLSSILWLFSISKTVAASVYVPGYSSIKRDDCCPVTVLGICHIFGKFYWYCVLVLFTVFIVVAYHCVCEAYMIDICSSSACIHRFRRAHYNGMYHWQILLSVSENLCVGFLKNTSSWVKVLDYDFNAPLTTGSV